MLAQRIVQPLPTLGRQMAAITIFVDGNGLGHRSMQPFQLRHCLGIDHVEAVAGFEDANIAAACRLLLFQRRDDVGACPTTTSGRITSRR